MTFGELKTLARLYAPGAKIGKIEDTELELILNNGAIDVARQTICLPDSKKFNAKADTGEYLITDVVSDFLVMAESGLWYKNGDTYKALNVKTLEWLDENMPNWRDRDSGTPQYYYQEGNVIGVVPVPSSAVTDGFWLYYGKKPQKMDDDNHFPFGHTTEYPHLTILHEAILFYWKWKARYALNDGADDYRMAENTYAREITKRKAQLKQRPDVQASKYSKYQGRKIRRGF